MNTQSTVQQMQELKLFGMSKLRTPDLGPYSNISKMASALYYQ